MITITLKPRGGEILFEKLVLKERELKKAGKGTLHAADRSKKGQVRWTHVRYPGKIAFEKSIAPAKGGVVAKLTVSKASQQWQLLTSFVGFLDRYFRDVIESLQISYDRK